MVGDYYFRFHFEGQGQSRRRQQKNPVKGGCGWNEVFAAPSEARGGDRLRRWNWRRPETGPTSSTKPDSSPGPADQCYTGGCPDPNVMSACVGTRPGSRQTVSVEAWPAASKAPDVVRISLDRRPDVAAASRLVQAPRSGQPTAYDDRHDRTLADLDRRHHSASLGCHLRRQHPDEHVERNVYKVTSDETGRAEVFVKYRKRVAGVSITITITDIIVILCYVCLCQIDFGLTYVFWEKYFWV